MKAIFVNLTATLALMSGFYSVNVWANTSDDTYTVKGSQLSFDLESNTPGTGFSRTFYSLMLYATPDMNQTPILTIDQNSKDYTENLTFSAEDGSFSLSIYSTATGDLVFSATSINSLKTDPDATHIWSKIPGFVVNGPNASFVSDQL